MYYSARYITYSDVMNVLPSAWRTFAAQRPYVISDALRRAGFLSDRGHSQRVRRNGAEVTLDDVAELAQRIHDARRDMSRAEFTLDDVTGLTLYLHSLRDQRPIDPASHRWLRIAKIRKIRDIQPALTPGEQALAPVLRRAWRLLRDGYPPTEDGLRASKAARTRQNAERIRRDAELAAWQQEARAATQPVRIADALREVVDAAVLAGAHIDYRSPSGSVYLKRSDGGLLRVADHRVPENALRVYGPSWSRPETMGTQILLRGRRGDIEEVSRIAVDKWKREAVAWASSRN